MSQDPQSPDAPSTGSSDLVAGHSLGPERLQQLTARAPRDSDGRIDITTATALLLDRGLTNADLEMMAANLLENGSSPESLSEDLNVVRAAFDKVRKQVTELARATFGLSRIAVHEEGVRLLGSDPVETAASQAQAEPTELQVRVRVLNLNSWWREQLDKCSPARKEAHGG